MVIIFDLCVNYSPNIILNDELIHIRLNLNDGAASKIGQFEQFHFADLVKIARLITTGKNTFQFTIHTPVQFAVQIGVLYRIQVTHKIFFQKKNYFLHQQKLFTQKFSGKVTYFEKFVKIYFDRARCFIFNIILQIFFQFF